MDVVLEMKMRVDAVAQIFDGVEKRSEMVVMRTGEGTEQARLEVMLGSTAFGLLQEKRFYKVLVVPCTEED